jgi:DNA-binding response OmpR family regulator
MKIEQDRAVPGRRLLVVEDHGELRELLQLYLTSAGYDVDAATDGEEGLAHALRTRPDAMVVDLAMPGIDGCELVRRLRADAEHPLIPVLLYSGIPDTDPRVAELCRLPKVAYEPKGHLRRLVATLESLLDPASEAQPVP